MSFNICITAVKPLPPSRCQHIHPLGPLEVAPQFTDTLLFVFFSLCSLVFILFHLQFLLFLHLLTFSFAKSNLLLSLSVYFLVSDHLVFISRILFGKSFLYLLYFYLTYWSICLLPLTWNVVIVTY